MGSRNDVYPLRTDIEDKIRAGLEKWHIPSASLSIVHGDLIYSNAFGNSVLNPDRAARDSDLYFTGSTTKAFLCAAWAIHLASEENRKKNLDERIRWATPLYALLGEDFVAMDDWATRHLTLEDSLCHRSGYAAHNLSYGHAEADTPKEITRILRYIPMSNEIRTKYEYNNMFYVAASYALERVTGLSVAAYLKQHIWDVLDMSDTYFNTTEALEAEKQGKIRLARGYGWKASENGGGKFVPEPLMHFHEVSGAGQIISSTRDYIKWMRCLLNPSDRLPISESIRSELFHPRIVCSRNEAPYRSAEHYALGWTVRNYGGEEMVSHAGGLVGFGALVILIPRLKFGITMACNSGLSSALLAESVCMSVVDDLIGVPDPERFDWDAKNWKIWTEARERRGKAIATLYSNAKRDVKPSVELAEYAGRYYHRAYHFIALSVPVADSGGRSLEVDFGRRTWSQPSFMEHVSGEHWLLHHGTVHWDENWTTPYKSAFNVGADGCVKRFGVVFEGEEQYIWFDRV